MLILGVIASAYLLVGIGFWSSFECFVVPLRKAYHDDPALSDHLAVLFLWVFVLCVGIIEKDS